MEMDLSRAAFSTFLLAAALIAGSAAAQGSLEIIPLRHRTADQVLPALRPLMEPGATLTGQGTQLIVRTSPANLEELRRALDEIDRPQRRLQISVRFEDSCSFFVGRELFPMLATVDLHDKTFGMTSEVDDVSSASNLPSEMGPRCRESMAQVPPELPLRFGRAPTHATSEPTLRSVDRPITRRPDPRLVIR